MCVPPAVILSTTVRRSGNNASSWPQEKERLKKEKKDEKRLNKERKLELRRLELEKAKELKKPNEDMCLADHEVFTHCGAAGR